VAVLRKSSDVAEDGIVTVNERQRIVLFNRGAERIFGLSRSEELGQSLYIIIPARFEPVHAKHVVNFAHSDIDARWMGERSEFYGRRKDGSEFPADVSISKLAVKGEMYLTAICPRYHGTKARSGSHSETQSGIGATSCRANGRVVGIDATVAAKERGKRGLRIQCFA
jgi:PAS domain S-box-containing protein